MPIVYLTRIEKFSSAHRLHSPHLSDAENARIYGKCNNKQSHGHNYTCEVMLKGETDAKTGMVMNVADLKVIFQEKIMSILDHKHIDDQVEYFKSVPSTVENLAVFIFEELKTVVGDLMYSAFTIFERSI